MMTDRRQFYCFFMLFVFFCVELRINRISAKDIEEVLGDSVSWLPTTERLVTNDRFKAIVRIYEFSQSKLKLVEQYDAPKSREVIYLEKEALFVGIKGKKTASNIVKNQELWCGIPHGNQIQQQATLDLSSFVECRSLRVGPSPISFSFFAAGWDDPSYLFGYQILRKSGGFQFDKLAESNSSRFRGWKHNVPWIEETSSPLSILVNTGKWVQVFKANENQDFVYLTFSERLSSAETSVSAEISPDNRYLATMRYMENPSEYTKVKLELWDISSGAYLDSLTIESNESNLLLFANERSLFLLRSNSFDQVTILENPANGSTQMQLRTQSQVTGLKEIYWAFYSPASKSILLLGTDHKMLRDKYDDEGVLITVPSAFHYKVIPLPD